MAQKLVIKKIFQTVLIMFIILTISTIPITDKKKISNVLRTNLEIEDITNLTTNNIYLLNKDNLLVKTSIFIDNKKEIIPKIIDYITINNKDIPKKLHGYIPKNTKLLDYSINQNTITLDFTKDFLTSSESTNNKIITGIVYTMLELDYISKVSITIEGEKLANYPKILDKSIGINNQYEIESRKDINKVVVYYLDKDNYYTPVTKYLNDNREKVEIIIEELKKTMNNQLKSPLNIKTNLKEYREEENVLYLNFDEYLLDKNNNTKEKIINTIAYSVFENYDIQMVIFEVNSKEIEYRSK